PTPERDARAGACGNRAALPPADLPPHPGEVVLSAPAAGHRAEQLLALAGDREVASDPARWGEHRRVDDRTHRPVDPVRADPLEVRERVGPPDVELREGRQAEKSGARGGGQGRG